MWTPSETDWIDAEQKREAAMDVLRIERNRRLAETDFTQIADWPGDPEPWRQYRQALRDMPENTDDPTNPQWPEKPE